jgi:trehalose/maltose transport system substrate-binding protein
MAVALGTGLTACGTKPSSSSAAGSSSESPKVLRIYSKTIGQSLQILRGLCDEFEAAHGVKVEITAAQTNVSDMLGLVRQYLEAESPAVDVFDIDVIWPAMLGEHFVDLSRARGVEKEAFIPILVENNTIAGRFVALPWYFDAAFLYVRTDLMNQLGTTVPKTLDELDTLAAFLHERRTTEDPSTPYALMIDGKGTEGMTCWVLELMAKTGVGPLVQSHGDIGFETTKLAGLLSRIQDWSGTLVPPEALNADLHGAQLAFEAGRALTLRNWTHLHAYFDNPSNPLHGKVATHPLPAGPGGTYHILGGFQLAVSRYSRNQDLAVALIVHLTSRHGQMRHALEGGFFPTRPELWDEPEVRSKVPHLVHLHSVLKSGGLLVRPSRVAGARYNELSSVVFREVSRVLRRELDPEEGARLIRQGVDRTISQ